MKPKEIRRTVGWSQSMIAAYARVGVASVRLYEVEPTAVQDPEKRASLARVYAALSVPPPRASA
jgi:hypothetical protein